MSATSWRGGIRKLWQWGRRMFVGVPPGAEVRIVERRDVESDDGRPVVSIVMGQWPADRVGDAVLSDRLGYDGIRRVVATVGKSGLSRVVWCVHGVEAMPRRTEWVARWLVALAESARGGAVEVDAAEIDEQACGALDAQLRRLGRRRGVRVETCI